MKRIALIDDLVAAVVAGEEDHPDSFVSMGAHILGTATNLGNGFFVTANHVIESAENKEMRLVMPSYVKDRYEAWKCSIVERLPRIDLALIKSQARSDFGEHQSNFESLERQDGFDLPQLGEKLNTFDDAKSIGYPFCQVSNIHSRGFSGNIVSNYKAGSSEVGMIRGGTWIYELSFPAPKGLSGGPVFVSRQNQRCLHGIVIGSRVTETEIIQVEETEMETTMDSRFEITETKTFISKHFLTTGIAVQLSELIEQTVGGKTVRDLVSSK